MEHNPEAKITPSPAVSSLFNTGEFLVAAVIFVACVCVCKRNI